MGDQSLWTKVAKFECSMSKKRRRVQSPTFKMSVVAKVRQSKRLRTESHLLAAKGVLQEDDENPASERSLTKANNDYATVERFNYNAACLNAHRGCRAMSITCDATDVGNKHYLAHGFFNLDNGKCSFGPVRVTL